MAYDPPCPRGKGIPRSSRLLISAGYALLPALLGLLWVAAPRDGGKLGGAALFAMTMMAGLVGSAVLWLIGAATAIEALVRARGQFRWFDYALLVAGIMPLAALIVGLLLPS